jgi:hypothetical protein
MLDQDFQSLLEALRNNDPSVTNVDFSCAWHWDGVAAGYGGALGRALAQNTVVSFIALEVSLLLAESDTTIDSAAPLILYLRNSSSLLHASLQTNMRARGSFEALEDALLGAIAENASIEVLLLDRIDLWRNSRVQVLRSKLHSLKKLSINLTSSDNSNQVAVANRLFDSTYGANHTLTELTVFGRDTDFSSFLPHLHSVRNLRNLDLLVARAETMTTACFHILAQFLYSTRMLSHLSLTNFKLRGDDASEMLVAMSKSTVSSLLLCKCEFDTTATESFIKLVQGTGEENPMCDLTVHKVAFDNLTLGQVLAVCLIGSPLKELFWSHREGGSDPDVGTFFDHLATMPYKISLDTLSLPRLNALDAESMARFLPMSTSLRILKINAFVDPASHVQLLSAVRQNGSLLNVSGRDDDAIIPFLTRNVFFRRPRIRDMLAENGEEALRYFPTFFRAAQGALRTAPNSMLIGLLAAAGDVIGPKFDKKGELAAKPIST